jgi:hypothetical protein
MPSTYTLISSNVLSSAAASVTFSAIPSTYTDLHIRWSARCSSEQNLIRLTFNGSGGTAYSDTGLNGDGSAGSYTQNSNSAYNRLNFSMVTSGYSANTFSNAELYIPSYTVSQNKPSSSFQVTETNDTRALLQTNANLWRDTSIISSITFTTNAGNFVSGSSFYLYGIKNS